jgi:uncharacterized membrane protein (DUF485 family)
MPVHCTNGVVLIHEYQWNALADNQLHSQTIYKYLQEIDNNYDKFSINASIIMFAMYVIYKFAQYYCVKLLPLSPSPICIP